LVAPVDDENDFPHTYASPTRGEEKKEGLSYQGRGKKAVMLLQKCGEGKLVLF